MQCRLRSWVSSTLFLREILDAGIVNVLLIIPTILESRFPSDVHFRPYIWGKKYTYVKRNKLHVLNEKSLASIGFDSFDVKMYCLYYFSCRKFESG